MTVFEKMMMVYLAIGVVSGVTTWYLARDKPGIRLLCALLIGATWPLSFPVALLFSLF
ncbi:MULTISPECIES: GhoT/OrtT family toxin [unclassified Pseudocitrobacter]|uniref:GhoT/OrtT family toxin n=1 Tax=unclassified Pseudocitrobacter TaxID=2638778 RepID=UPI0023E3A53B|nr:MULTISPECIES: GhoT/OrtT family toxin [unclassified Pseudocitrobacter]MDF3827756.1 GhoT/OrtT family toxin [Pseudocitrobacter sp. 2023EL-00150]MEC5373984.1 GhoT/OrtT family toxin [Pseudocitrobacter sp. MW920760]